MPLEDGQGDHHVVGGVGEEVPEGLLALGLGGHPGADLPAGGLEGPGELAELVAAVDGDGAVPAGVGAALDRVGEAADAADHRPHGEEDGEEDGQGGQAPHRQRREEWAGPAGARGGGEDHGAGAGAPAHGHQDLVDRVAADAGPAGGGGLAGGQGGDECGGRLRGPGVLGGEARGVGEEAGAKGDPGPRRARMAAEEAARAAGARRRATGRRATGRRATGRRATGRQAPEEAGAGAAAGAEETPGAEVPGGGARFAAGALAALHGGDGELGEALAHRRLLGAAVEPGDGHDHREGDAEDGDREAEAELHGSSEARIR